METTREKFLHELKDTYDAEHRFQQAMGDMRREASDAELCALLEQHISETEDHIRSLEEVFAKLGTEPGREPCDGANGIVSEGRKVIRQAKQDSLRDTLIAGALRKAEHYEIASYQGLIGGAETIGNHEVTKLLEQIFRQEESTAKRVQKAAPELLQKAVRAEARS